MCTSQYTPASPIPAPLVNPVHSGAESGGLDV